jgi:hypothetical protein
LGTSFPFHPPDFAMWMTNREQDPAFHMETTMSQSN